MHEIDFRGWQKQHSVGQPCSVCFPAAFESSDLIGNVSHGLTTCILAGDTSQIEAVDFRNQTVIRQRMREMPQIFGRASDVCGEFRQR